MTHPSNILTPPVDLLHCPVCGEPAELLFRPDRYPEFDGFVVFCQGFSCTGSTEKAFDNKEEACAFWNNIVCLSNSSNILTPPVELLPCPVCGKPAELHHRHDDPDGFVVFCEDIYCAGNCVPEFSTKEEACAAWNDLARRADFRWYKSSCPNCGWSEADEQDFLEHQRNLPEPPRWKRIFWRVGSWIKFSDLYLFAVVFLLIRGFDDVLRSQGIESGFITPYDQFMVSASFAVLPVAFRAIYDFLHTYIRDRELKAFFDTTDNTTTTPTIQGENHD